MRQDHADSSASTSATSDSETIASAMDAAIEAASMFVGAVSPNPPVGCAVLDAQGRLLVVEAHQRAGSPHAEARAITRCRELGLEARIDTIVVTLEPCSHVGRTPPCVDAILGTPARRIVIGARDPNRSVAGGGATRLASAGRDVVFIETLRPAQAMACARLIAPFEKWITMRRPWLTVKTAWTRDGSMLPPPGRKTFTSALSLDLAHRLRRRADAIITGSGTVLADRPLFTVRRLPDHPDKRRTLVILDRRNRVDAAYLASAATHAFDVLRADSLDDALARLGDAGVVEALLEAGPTLSRSILQGTHWDEHVRIQQADEVGAPDIVSHSLRRIPATLMTSEARECSRAS